MRAIITTLLFSSFLQAQDLDNYLWKNRIVIIFKTVNDNTKLEKQLELFNSYSDEIEDRNMIVLIPNEDEKHIISEKFNVDANYQGLILVGKDGGIKFKQKLVVDPKILFSLIDSMPMRKSEMRRNSKKPD